MCPKSTLYDRVRGKAQHGTKPGAIPYLTSQEEDELLKFLVRCVKLDIISSYCESGVRIGTTDA